MRLAEEVGAAHRRIEEPLDQLEVALGAGAEPAARVLFEEASRLAEAHFLAEEAILFPALRQDFLRLVAKMEDQHAQVRELAAACQAAALAGGAEFLHLARRFHALLQHHLIEEERDLLALVDRFLPEAGRQALAGAFRQAG